MEKGLGEREKIANIKASWELKSSWITKKKGIYTHEYIGLIWTEEEFNRYEIAELIIKKRWSQYRLKIGR